MKSKVVVGALTALLAGSLIIQAPAVAADPSGVKYTAVKKGKCPAMGEKITLKRTETANWRLPNGKWTKRTVKKGTSVCRLAEAFDGSWNLFAP